MLSIVIPAFRAAYLGEALASLRAQTNKDFEVIVADDASPDDLRAIFDEGSTGLDATFSRFDQNLGGQSLTSHWERAIKLARGEWIMLLGDDDVLHEQAVEDFYDARKSTDAKYDVYRFNTQVIDRSSDVIRTNPPHPESETGLDFLLARLRWQRRSYTCEYIFSLNRFQEIGGFVEFPLAWCSDDATWIALAERTGIYTVQPIRSFWRMSGDNISSAKPELAAIKLEATTRFLCWMKHQLAETTYASADFDLRNAIIKEGPNWFFQHLWNTPVPLGLANMIEIARKLSRCSDSSYSRNLLKFARHDLRCLMQRN